VDAWTRGNTDAEAGAAAKRKRGPGGPGGSGGGAGGGSGGGSEDLRRSYEKSLLRAEQKEQKPV